MSKDDWIAQFVTELSFRSTPALPVKFAQLAAMERWVTHFDQNLEPVARVWFAARGRARSPPEP
jgi:hypothetical protein